MGVFEGFANTIGGIDAEIGSIVAIKGGAGGWIGRQMGIGIQPAIKGFQQAFGQGGWGGMMQHGKHFFGIGWDEAAKKGKGHMVPYLQTAPKAATAYAQRQYSAGIRRRGLGPITPSAMKGAGRVYRGAGRTLAAEAKLFGGYARGRQITGGVGAAAGLIGVSSTVGLGNAAMMGGAGIGMAGAARYIGKGRGWTGGRAGKFGAAATGLGLLTGVI